MMKLSDKGILPHIVSFDDAAYFLQTDRVIKSLEATRKAWEIVDTNAETPEQHRQVFHLAIGVWTNWSIAERHAITVEDWHKLYCDVYRIVAEEREQLRDRAISEIESRLPQLKKRVHNFKYYLYYLRYESLVNEYRAKKDHDKAWQHLGFRNPF